VTDRKTKKQLHEENDKLRRLCRFQFFTLGHYGTQYNYDNPHSEGGVMHDRGKMARESNALAFAMGFTRDEIDSWAGPRTEDLCALHK